MAGSTAVPGRDTRLPVGAALAARAAALGTRLAADPGVRLAVMVVVGLRLLLGCAALLGISAVSTDPAAGEHLEAQTRSTATLWPLVGPFERWDALWYLHLARDGYSPGGGDGAYEPMFVILIRAVALPLGGNVGLAAWLLVTASLVVALAVVWHLVAGVLGDERARLTVLAMAVYPAAFFMLAPYPEPVFLALSAGALLAGSRRHWAAAGGLAALAVLCRPQGVVVLLALGVEALVAARTSSAAGRAGGAVTGTLRRLDPAAVVATVFPVVPLAVWFAYCRFSLDLALGPLTPLHDRWGHHAAWPWTVLADSLAQIGTGQKLEEIGNLVMVVVVAAAIPLMWRRLPPAWTAYTVATLLIAVCGEARWTPLMSWMRYAAVLFPVFALAGLWAVGAPAWARRGLALTALAAQLWLFELYVHYTFVA